MFEKEPKSPGSLKWRVALNANRGARAERARAVPKLLEYFCEDGEVVDAGGENTSQSEKHLVAIGCVDDL